MSKFEDKAALMSEKKRNTENEKTHPRPLSSTLCFAASFERPARDPAGVSPAPTHKPFALVSTHETDTLPPLDPASFAAALGWELEPPLHQQPCHRGATEWALVRPSHEDTFPTKRK